MSLNVSYMQIKQWKCFNLIRIADTCKKTNIGFITFDYLYCEKRLGATVIFSFIKTFDYYEILCCNKYINGRISYLQEDDMQFKL